MSKRAEQALARKSLQHGYFDKGSTLEVTCPLCRQRVSALPDPRRTHGAVLAAAVGDHARYSHRSLQSRAGYWVTPVRFDDLNFNDQVIVGGETRTSRVARAWQEDARWLLQFQDDTRVTDSTRVYLIRFPVT